MKARRYDLAVIGAGPAGAALALETARGGAAVLLVDRCRFDAPRIGETAPPEIRRSAAALGVADLLEDPGIAREAPAVVSVWGADQPAERHHIFSPYGPAVHLSRQAFDRALADRAAVAGAMLRLGNRARVERNGDGSIRLQLDGGEAARADFVALAGGRWSGGAGLEPRRVPLNDHVCLVAFLEGTPGDSRTMVEAVAAGWIYAAALPRNRTVVALTTRAGMIPGTIVARIRFWKTALDRSLLIGPAIMGLAPPATISVVNSRASLARRTGGPRWCVLGDARFAPDPLSGQGVLSALEDASFVAGLLLRSRSEDIANELRTISQADAASHAAASAAAYGAERRFANERFWSTIVRRETS